MGVGPRILIFDIETSYDILASYGLREQYHSSDNILQDWYIICFCWKWYDGTRIYNCSVLDDLKRFRKSCADDCAVVKKLHELLSEVDIVVGHNVSKFDWKMFMARVIYHGLPPIDCPRFVDTLKEAKNIARFTRNTLKYLAKYLKITNKPSHAPDLGLRVLRGERKAIEEMVEYCRGDVESSEALYNRLRPYMLSHPNHNLWRGDGVECCTNCGSTHIISNGTRTTLAGRFTRLQCQNCGKWMRSVKRERGVKIR